MSPPKQGTPGIDYAMSRRHRRRLSFMQEGFWMPKYYPAETVPIDLGINEYKRQHSDKKRVAFYKKEMWNEFNALRHQDIT